MESIAISAGALRPKQGAQSSGPIGVTEQPRKEQIPARAQAPPGEPMPLAAKPLLQKQEPSEIQKVVRKMPTLYVITFFGVVVACAVLIIWNTLQVNRLTAERTKLDDKIRKP